MATRCESTSAVAIGAGPLTDLEGASFEHLMQVGGPGARAPLTCLRVADRDLVICDGAGVVLYALQVTSTTAGWRQRAIFYLPDTVMRALLEDPNWARRARRLCLTSAQAHASRVPVGVVAADARGAEGRGDLFDGEEAIYRLSEAAGALLQSAGRQAAKSGRRLMACIESARAPSHVPLYRLQRAFAEELALGRSVAALCSRSPGFSDSEKESEVTALLCQRLGLQGMRDYSGHTRYGRVASAATAELLCEALDVAPEQVGL